MDIENLEVYEDLGQCSCPASGNLGRKSLTLTTNNGLCVFGQHQLQMKGLPIARTVKPQIF